MTEDQNKQLELETLLRKIAGHLGRPVDTVRAQLGLAARETTEATQQEIGSKTPERRPDWIKARKRGTSPPAFINDAFAAELADRSMHKGLFSRYENLRRDFYAYQRHHEVPDWLKSIPTQSEWNDRQVAEGKIKLTPVDEVRTHHRDKMRISRARTRGVAPFS